MSTDREVTGIVRSWLEEGATSLPERVLDDVLAQVPTTPQRRASWPAWRFHSMSPFRIALVAAAIGALALVSIDVLPRSPDIGGAAGPSASPSPSPAPLGADGPLPAGTYSVDPFVPPYGWTLCMDPPQPGCVETPDDDAITFTFTVPEGWEEAPFKSIWLADEQNAEPGGAGLGFSRGGSLYSDPCISTSTPSTPDIAVGPSVDEFADALADHPLLDVTTPVDVTLDGYAGRYLELRTPADISACDPYQPWEPGLFSQPSRVWHLWILDVDGVRVVVTTTDYPGTAPEARAELEGIVDSIRIHVAPTPDVEGSPEAAGQGPALSWQEVLLDEQSLRLPDPAAGRGQSATRIAWVGDRFVLVDQDAGAVSASTDGTSWILQEPGSPGQDYFEPMLMDSHASWGAELAGWDNESGATGLRLARPPDAPVNKSDFGGSF
jgi:hypothetical protein